MCSSSSKTVDSSKTGEKSSGIHLLELHGNSCIVAIVSIVVCILILYYFIHKKCSKKFRQNRELRQQQLNSNIAPHSFATRFKNSFRGSHTPNEPQGTHVNPPWNSKDRPNGS